LRTLSTFMKGGKDEKFKYFRKRKTTGKEERGKTGIMGVL